MRFADLSCSPCLRVSVPVRDPMKAAKARLRLPGVRIAVAEVAGPLCRLRRVELVCRRARRRRPAAARAQGHRYALPGSATAGRAALRRHRSVAGRSHSERHRRVRSRARRRHRARLARAARRRARHRQVDAAAAGGRALRADTSGTVLYASGEESEHQIKSRGDRLGVGDAPLYPARRDLHREHPRGDRPRPAAAAHRRLGADGVLAEVPVGAGQHRPGARSGDAVSVHRQGPQHSDVSRRPRDEGRQHRRSQGARARRRHGALLRGRAAPFASRGARGQEPLRRDQRARRLRDDRQRAQAGRRIRRRSFSPSGRWRRRDRRCSARSKARGRSSSRCRRWPAPRRTAWRKRMAVGIDQNRLSLLLAVLEKRAGLHLVERRRVRQHRRRHEHRRAGRRSGDRLGRRVERAQPARWSTPPPSSARSGWAAKSAASRRPALRIREAEQMGFTRVVLPAANVDGELAPAQRPARAELVGVRHVGEALDALLT